MNHPGTGAAVSSNPVARAYNSLITGLAVVAGAIFGLMAFFIGADVLVRNTVGGGLAWVIETMEYAMYVATIFAAPWVLREGAHVSVDVVTSNLPEGLRRVVSCFVCLLGSAICFVICYYSALATLKAFERGSQIYKTFTIPEWTISIFVPFGMLLVAIEFLLLFRGELRSPAHVSAR
ncbi:TRAP transporter small permease [Pusillimonas noertemannii]|uniref:TRAP transporter small permease protein n=1 Tax=Pusillimonas noertemannii TaxID=305977 RepID=A0A2U1CLX4_9BURK|nr:TRAP transporter small permease [Pusillimonas noertemannii]NYT68982.1 TRAP transporter small permease [Pusillimonas noertemannii]PVY61998.1 TRAP-type C4-dicarboxylate transport system permease small subunit [Pusillimonas noertemannii]TFL10994.1 TRAP transporter small permease [Pusillimonas noertemannii]